jgi:hypothetical protein
MKQTYSKAIKLKRRKQKGDKNGLVAWQAKATAH